MQRAFYKCSNLNITNPNIDSPDLSKVTNMSYMFRDGDKFNGDVTNWDVSNVTNMSYMFADTALFNQLLNWDVSKVTNMSYMFSNATVFNQPLNWDVSSLTNISYMFRYTGAFNETLSWDNTSSITNMSYVFHNAKEFNQPLDWNVSSVTNMYGMFWVASSFNQPLNWDVSKVTNMSNMFRSASAFNQPLDWNVSSVTNMDSMFYNAKAFNQDISSWVVSNVTNMSAMFEFARVFNQPLDWDVSSVTSMNYMFYNANEFNQNLSNCDVSNVTNMKNMFYEATAFDQDLSSWGVSNVRNMSQMFNGVTLSAENYDALLKGWSVQTLQTGVAFSGGNSKYCTAETERQSIIDNLGWTITDGGKVGTPILEAISDVNEEGSYILPTIEGTDLLGTEKYYTEIEGVRTEYEIGDVLNYADFTTYPVVFYAYDLGSCDGAIIEESFSVTLNVGVLGVNENEILSSTISIGPNPSNNYIKIDLNTSDAVLIQVFNLGGKLVLNNKEYFSKELINISHLREGVYLVKVTNKEGGNVTRKIVKTK